MELDDVVVAQDNSLQTDRLLDEHHYIGAAPAIQTKHRYLITGGLKYGVCGAAQWTPPAARGLPQGDWIELRRFWTADWTPKNTESLALAQMMAEMIEEYDVLLSYASINRHEGTIYRATNWCNMGLSWSAGSWESRDGREDRDTGPKWRFEYW